MTLPDAHMAQIAGVLDRLSLSRKEASLYVLLADARGRVLTYGFIIEQLREAEGYWTTEESIRSRLRRMRPELARHREAIEAVYGVGLRLTGSGSHPNEPGRMVKVGK